MIHGNTYVRGLDFNGAKGLVFLGDKLLVYRRDQKTDSFPLHIDLPGGGREEGESPFETYRREVKEEFGLDIQETDVVFSGPYLSSKPPKESYFIIVKLPASSEAEVVFGEEGVEWMLMDVDEFLVRPDGIKNQQERVGRFLKEL